MTDPKQPEADPARARSDEPEADEPQRPKPASGMSYVFKIAPADPKNKFDFEDVADK